MAAQIRKMAKLAALEAAWREEQQKGRSSWFWSSFASSFSSTIAENLQVVPQPFLSLLFHALLLLSMDFILQYMYVLIQLWVCHHSRLHWPPEAPHGC